MSDEEYLSKKSFFGDLIDQKTIPSTRIEGVVPKAPRDEVLSGQRYLSFVPANTDLAGQRFMPEIIWGTSDFSLQYEA